MLNKETVMLKVALIYSITKKLEKRENYSMDWPKKKEEKPVVPFGFSAAESNCEEGTGTSTCHHFNLLTISLHSFIHSYVTIVYI